MTVRALSRLVGPTLMVVIAWFGLATATNGAIDESEREAEATARAVAVRQQAGDDLVAFSEFEMQATAAVERIDAGIPAAVDVPQLITVLAATDASGELAVEVISPNPTPQPLPWAAVDSGDGLAGALSRVGISISGTGTYPATLAYLDRIAQSERLFRIRSVELHGDGGGDRVSFTFEVDAFTTMTAGPSTVGAAPAAVAPTATVPTPVIAFEEE